MTEKPRDGAGSASPAPSSYAGWQLARAVKSLDAQTDPEARERVARRIAQWQQVLSGIDEGSISPGSRQPLGDVPVWVTLEVATGGFATGSLLAGGALQDHERSRLASLPTVVPGLARLALNVDALSETGLAGLQTRLDSGEYTVNVPEEGALLAFAWLLRAGQTAAAQQLLDTLLPWFEQLRFYPAPATTQARTSAHDPLQHRVHLQSVGTTARQLQRARPNPQVAAQKEAIEIWIPLHDRVVAQFLETECDGWPCRHYPQGWSARARLLIEEFERLRRVHTRCRRVEDPSEHATQLRLLLGRSAEDPTRLSGRDVGRIRQILNAYRARRGEPGSDAHRSQRQRQQADVAAPLHADLAHVLAQRLQTLPANEGLDDLTTATADITADEGRAAGLHHLPGDRVTVPASLRRKLRRCLDQPVVEWVEQGLVTSADALAELLPQITGAIAAQDLADPALQRLHGAIYRAFRRRRSLLLLNLASQVRLEELPWVAAIQSQRQLRDDHAAAAREALAGITMLALRAFPQAILPNTLLQELRTLAETARLDLPLTDELAADIFAGRFSDKFVQATLQAGERLSGSLYASYYGIDYAALCDELHEAQRRGDAGVRLGQLCAARAGTQASWGNVAGNGMIIEQQQILSTHNLATLFTRLDLDARLRHSGTTPELLARQAFGWICQRMLQRPRDWHAQLIMIKNVAYAWRQIVLFLSLPGAGPAQSQAHTFADWAEALTQKHPGSLHQRLQPVIHGLRLAAQGIVPEGPAAERANAQRLLGWSRERHWLRMANA